VCEIVPAPYKRRTSELGFLLARKTNESRSRDY
jgi:hypothetical protein